MLFNKRKYFINFVVNIRKNSLIMKFIKMKNILLTIAFLTILVNVNAQRIDTKEKVQNEVENVNATIDFESKVIDYGVIENGSDGTRKFVFTNNGTEPLIIKNAKGSCGCTVPTWPRDPILPGSSGEIGVKYDTKRVGQFTKTITLTTNADKRPVILTIKGNVNGPVKESPTPQRKSSGAPLEKK